MRDFRVHRDVLNETSADDLVWRVIEPAYDAVSIHDGAEVLDSQLASLTAGQRALLALHWTGSEVSNGGFDQYFTNPTGDLADEALAGFKRIGAQRTAQLLEQVLAAFPGGAPPRDADTRLEMLDAMNDEDRDGLFEQFDQQFYDLLDAEIYETASAYIRAHPNEFFKD